MWPEESPQLLYLQALWIVLFKQGRTGMPSGCRRCQKKEKKKPDKFKHKWMLNPRYWSLCYVERNGFYCVLCKKHNMKSTQNKSQTFIESPSKWLKEDLLKTHGFKCPFLSGGGRPATADVSFSSQLYWKKWSSNHGSLKCVCHCLFSHERIRC